MGPRQMKARYHVLNSGGPSSTSLLDLSADILCTIYKAIGSGEDRKSLRHSCKALYGWVDLHPSCMYLFSTAGCWAIIWAPEALLRHRSFLYA